MRRCATMWMMLAGLLFLVGCPGGDEPADEATGEDTEQVSTPEEVSPLELLPSDPKPVPASDPADEPQLEAEPETEPTVEIEAPTRNAVHRIAGRSAFPEAGESITQLIPAKKLSDEDQFVTPIDESDIPDVVPWDEAHKYVGHTITVEGKIVDVGSINEGSVNFLNFHKDWRGKFYLVMFGDLAKKLDKSVSATFLNKTVRVTGEVEDHRGRPQVKILSMDQVEFVGE